MKMLNPVGWKNSSSSEKIGLFIRTNLTMLRKSTLDCGKKIQILNVKPKLETTTLKKNKISVKGESDLAVDE